jgi:putative transposase
MLGAAYQRCRVHFLRNVFAVIPKDAAEMVAATIRTIFAQPTAELVRSRLDTVADMLGRQYPKVKTMLLEAKVDLTAFADFPERHWKEIQSTNPLERVNREIRRRVDVVQIFPNPGALERLTTAVLIEMHDEWVAFPRHYLPEGSMDKIYPADDQPARLHHYRGHDQGESMQSYPSGTSSTTPIGSHSFSRCRRSFSMAGVPRCITQG